MIRSISAALAFVILAAPAGAQCVTAADLTRGVVVGFASGDRTISRLLPDGYVQVDEHYANGNLPKRFRAAHGIYFVDEYEIGAGNQPTAGSHIQIRFPTDPLELPAPTVGGAWKGRTTNVFDDGTERPEATSIRFSDTPDVTLSGCTYDAILADLRYDWGDAGGLTLQYVYLPEVGMAFILNNQFDGGEKNVTEAVSLAVHTK